MAQGHLVIWQPSVIARRIAVSAAAARPAGGRRSLPQTHEGVPCPELVDDLCALSGRLDQLGISDAALACASVDADPCISTATGIAYSARLALRKASLLGEHDEALDRSHKPRNPPALDACRKSSKTLAGALEQLRFAKVVAAWAPRALLESLGPATGVSDAAVRMLLAAYADDDKPLRAALRAAPFDIEPSNVARAFDGLGVQGGARATLAHALPRLGGIRAKEAGATALEVLDAARKPPDDLVLFGHGKTSRFSLHDALRRTAMALAAVGLGAGASSDIDLLLSCAAACDRVWEQMENPPLPARRVQLFAESGLALEIKGLVLTPLAEAAGHLGSIVFVDLPGGLLPWQQLAGALDVPDAQLDYRHDGGLHVEAETELCDAVSAYALEKTSVECRSFRPWPRPEERVPVLAPAMVFSASRLNVYSKCPRRWFFEYLCGVLEDPASLHAAYGRVVHDALERLHQEIRVPSRHNSDLILERLLRELDASFGRAREDFGSQLEYEVSRARARRMAEHYVQWLALEASKAPFEIVAVEVCARQKFGAYEFTGFIDRIDKPLEGGPVTIYDYKTGRIDTDASQYLEKIRRGEEAQLALYYAMRTASGDDVARIALVSIKDHRDDVWILALDVLPDDPGELPNVEEDGVLKARCSKADLDAAMQALLQRCDVLTTVGSAHFEAGADPPCGYCAYARACRERPIEGERIFAR